IRNSLIPVVTILGLQAGALMSGAVVTEQIFVVPGFGRLIVEAVFTRDYPLVQGVVLITASSYVLINLLVDLSYSLLDPRIRVGGGPWSPRWARCRRPAWRSRPGCCTAAGGACCAGRRRCWAASSCSRSSQWRSARRGSRAWILSPQTGARSVSHPAWRIRLGPTISAATISRVSSGAAGCRCRREGFW